MIEGPKTLGYSDSRTFTVSLVRSDTSGGRMGVRGGGQQVPNVPVCRTRSEETF